jgi:hypothetical protein
MSDDTPSAPEPAPGPPSDSAPADGDASPFPEPPMDAIFGSLDYPSIETRSDLDLGE